MTELNQQETYDIRYYDFPVGSFPIRYLGLLLMHLKLRISKYSLLLDKISKRFQIWSARSLSFAWCLQLLFPESGSLWHGTVITIFRLPASGRLLFRLKTFCIGNHCSTLRPLTVRFIKCHVGNISWQNSSVTFGHHLAS
ncbi:hypothetical protein YC2023_106229 [Brassica napus]